MDSTFVICIVGAAVTLLLSGAAKVRTPESAAELEQLGIPAPLRSALVTRVHPWFEVALGLALLLTRGPLLVAVASINLALMIGYSFIVGRAVRAGEARSCNCFGNLVTQQLTWRSVVRNALLTVNAAAVLVWTSAGRTLLDTSTSEPTSLLALLPTLLIGVLVWATVSSSPAPATPASVSQPAMDVDGTDYIRHQTPLAWLREPDGTARTLREISQDRARLLVYLTTTCEPCATVAAEVSAWIAEFPFLGVHPTFITGPETAEAVFPELAPHALYDVEAETIRALDVAAFPAAVLLGMDGMLAGGPVYGPEAILAMVDELRQESASIAEKWPEQGWPEQRQDAIIS